MNNPKFIKDYKHNKEYREAFVRRTREIFNFDITPVYDGGYWSGVYIPYSFVADGEIAANVSVITQDFLFGGLLKKGILLECVLSSPEYRGQGLAGHLMRAVLDEYENKTDFFCLYSTPEAVGFYPRFGFSRVLEHRYVVSPPPLAENCGRKKRKLNLDMPEDLALVREYVNSAMPLSKQFCVAGDKSFLMFEFVAGRARNILWHLEDLDAVAAAEERDGTLYVNHVLSRKPAATDDIIAHFPSRTTRNVVFGYIPDIPSASESKFTPIEEAAFFVRSKFEFSGNFMMPYYARS